jgi:ferredoxin
MEYREEGISGQKDAHNGNQAEPTMCAVRIGHHVVKCPQGANLRKVLMENGCTPYHKDARFVHCRGVGTCGTCAVQVVSGQVNEPGRLEKARLMMPPFNRVEGLRLACQCKVISDVAVVKHPGFWGERKT